MDTYIIYTLGVIAFPFCLSFFAKLSNWVLNYFMSKTKTESERYFIIMLFVAIMIFLIKKMS